MIQYRILNAPHHRKFIHFHASFPHDESDTLFLQLASWRPGRYELGNFAKNIRGFQAFNEQGKKLMFQKVTKDLWAIEAKGLASVRISYEYYASELNAGSSYLNSEMLYINPVNCFFYKANDIEQPYTISFDLPENYDIACGLTSNQKRELVAKNFDELADCPLIASATMRRLYYTYEGVKFHLCIQGNFNVPDDVLIKDFSAFTKSHFDMFGDIPCSEYFFLLHFPPYFIRHGVEHHNSTVIAMGPATEFNQPAGYKDLLGISCHELFHTWNIKSIRPSEMMPYDFTRENYSDAGFIAEGVTTYYGDYLLYLSGLINENEWMEVLRESIQEHLDNDGRFNISVAQSSRETWLDGYTAGIPWRKVSIYNEGFLIALITDFEIRKATNNKASLADAMKELYISFGKKQRGYTVADYQKILEHISGIDFTWMFSSLVFGTEDYLPYIIQALDYFGYELRESASTKVSEARFGFSIDEGGAKNTISFIKKQCSADQSGLWYGDEIISVNRISPYKNIQNLLNDAGSTMKLHILRRNRLMEVDLKASGEIEMKKYYLFKKSSTTSKTEG